jgi:hypothetical protein
MDALKRFFLRNQEANSEDRRCYPVAQRVSDTKATRVKNARQDLQAAYNREMAKPASQRDSNLVFEMDKALYPRLCGW